MLAHPTKLATKDNATKVFECVNDITKEKDGSTNVPDEINAFRTTFDDVLDKAGIPQLVVLVDDLDQGMPDTAEKLSRDRSSK